MWIMSRADSGRSGWVWADPGLLQGRLADLGQVWAGSGSGLRQIQGARSRQGLPHLSETLFFVFFVGFPNCFIGFAGRLLRLFCFFLAFAKDFGQGCCSHADPRPCLVQVQASLGQVQA